LKYVDYFVDGNHGLKHNKWKQYKKIDNDTDKSIFYFDNLINDYQVFTINQKKFLLIHIFKAAHDDFWLTSKWDEYKEKVNAIIERYKVDYVVFGHTHKAEIIQKNNFLALNPGSLTRPELQPTGSYIIGKWINNSFVFKIKYLKK
jgi:putative phosphoesterase